MAETTFELEGDHVELNQLLKLCGVVDSGGAGKALVASGAVRVDGAVGCARPARSARARWWARGLRIVAAPPDPRRSGFSATRRPSWPPLASAHGLRPCATVG